MIVIINGSVGVGKTETSWELTSCFSKAIMLDGDYIGAVHPFEIYDQERVDYLYETLVYLISFHQSHGFDNFVINYVFEQPEQLTILKSLLVTLDSNIYCFWLTCDETEQADRITNRRSDHHWDLKRYIELNKIMREACTTGSIGREIVTTGFSAKGVAGEIFKQIT